MANTYIQRTASSAGNQKKWTFSAWVKKSSTGADAGIFGFPENSTNYLRIRFKSGDNIQIDNDYNDTLTMNLRTNAVYRDTNAWYHIVVAYDSAQATDTNRVKLWVNNEQVTSWDSPSYPSQNANTRLGNSGANIQVGATVGNHYFNGVMSHVHYCDGYAYAPSDFGETDSTTGEWRIKTSPSGLSYGTNGFWWLKDSIATTDHSSNSNNFTLGGGTLTKTEDNPSNVFATLNPLSSGTDLAFSSGNTTIINSTTTWNSVLGTLAFGTGKYYFEAQRISTNGTANIGITLSSKFGGNHSGVDAGRIMYSSNGYVYKDAWSLSNSTIATIGSGDIIGVSIDTENGILKFYKNGALVDTTTNSLLLSSNNEFIPAFALYDGGKWRVNFGNGYFQDNAISSAGNNASGNGIFEYDVQPTDATALSTKGLNL